MFNLNIPVNIGINDLSTKYLPFVDWKSVSQYDIYKLDPDKLMYVDVRVLMQCYLNNTAANMSEECVMSVISRELSELGNTYNYVKESKLADFIHKFCSIEIIKNNYRQIQSLLKISIMKSGNPKPHFEVQNKITPLFVMYGLMDTSYLVHNQVHAIDFSKLNDVQVPLDVRFKILKSGMALSYWIVNEYHLHSLVPVLKTEHLKQMPFMPELDVFDSYCIGHINGERYIPLHDKDSITWDELIDYYYNGELPLSVLEDVWDYYVRNVGDYEEINNAFQRKYSTAPKFTEEDFL